MVAKCLTFLCLVAVAAAGVVPVAPVSNVVYAEPETPPQYDYTYSVQDSHSGDVKQQQESRSGDAVHGSYSLIQPDGVQRIVEYTADDQHGFNAIVRYEGTPVQTAPTKVIAAAPVYTQAPVQNIAYAAPVAKVAYAAPVAKVAYAAPVPKVAYAAPIAKVAYPAPLSYAAPAPVTYAQGPAISYAAPITKLAYGAAPISKIAYSENLGRVSFSSPIVSYQH